jgi:hypothetical protein
MLRTEAAAKTAKDRLFVLLQNHPTYLVIINSFRFQKQVIPQNGLQILEPNSTFEEVRNNTLQSLLTLLTTNDSEEAKQIDNYLNKLLFIFLYRDTIQVVKDIPDEKNVNQEELLANRTNFEQIYGLKDISTLFAAQINVLNVFFTTIRNAGINHYRNLDNWTNKAPIDFKNNTVLNQGHISNSFSSFKMNLENSRNGWLLNIYNDVNKKIFIDNPENQIDLQSFTRISEFSERHFNMMLIVYLNAVEYLSSNENTSNIQVDDDQMLANIQRLVAPSFGYLANIFSSNSNQFELTRSILQYADQVVTQK